MDQAAESLESHQEYLCSVSVNQPTANASRAELAGDMIVFPFFGNDGSGSGLHSL